MKRIDYKTSCSGKIWNYSSIYDSMRISIDFSFLFVFFSVRLICVLTISSHYYLFHFHSRMHSHTHISFVLFQFIFDYFRFIFRPLDEEKCEKLVQTFSLLPIEFVGSTCSAIHEMNECVCLLVRACMYVCMR